MIRTVKGFISRKKSDIYQILIKHPFLDALQYVIRNSRNKDKCRSIAGRNGLIMQCASFGSENKERCIYYIRFGGARHGFFAQFRTLLKYIAYADRFGFAPVIEWSRELPYAEKEPVHGTLNPFEYYFEQPAGISMKEAKMSYNVFLSESIHITDAFLNQELFGGENGYAVSEEYVKRMGAVVQKYIRLNKWTKEYMEHELKTLLNNKKTVGVHVRGSDYKGRYNNHPTLVPIQDYVDSAEQLMQSGKYEQIFLATDDMDAICKFEERFGGQLVYYRDVVRTDGDVSVAFSDSTRKNHHYLLGLEVLRDMYSLAECDGLVAGISQVSNCARIVKSSYGKEYENMTILDKGINHTSVNFAR